MSSAVPALLQPNRRPAAASPAQTLLLPTDGSPAEEAAIGYVIEMARTAPVTVHLVNVQPAVMAGEVTVFTSAQMVTLQRRSAGEQVLKRASGALTAAGIAHTTHVALGSPATEIVRSAIEHECTKIVMATRNTGLMKVLLRRSVAHRVVTLAAVPVTLVKPSSAQIEARKRSRRPRPASRDIVHVAETPYAARSSVEV